MADERHQLVETFYLPLVNDVYCMLHIRRAEVGVAFLYIRTYIRNARQKEIGEYFYRWFPSLCNTTRIHLGT